MPELYRNNYDKICKKLNEQIANTYLLTIINYKNSNYKSPERKLTYKLSHYL